MRPPAVAKYRRESVRPFARAYERLASQGVKDEAICRRLARRLPEAPKPTVDQIARWRNGREPVPLEVTLALCDMAGTDPFEEGGPRRPRRRRPGGTVMVVVAGGLSLAVLLAFLLVWRGPSVAVHVVRGIVTPPPPTSPPLTPAAHVRAARASPTPTLNPQAPAHPPELPPATSPTSTPAADASPSDPPAATRGQRGRGHGRSLYPSPSPAPKHGARSETSTPGP